MTTDVYQFVLSIAGVLLMLFLGGNIYFFKGFIRSSRKVQESVEDIRDTIIREVQKNEDFRSSCPRTHEAVNRILDEYKRKLESHDKSITRLETKIDK